MTKITVHSLADLKNTSDDVIPTYLNSLGFTQSHTLTDTRLTIGYFAFTICAACFYWDYTLGFESTKYYSAIAVTLYTILNGALTYWIWAVEGHNLYIGTNKAGDRIQIATKTEKHIPIYNMTITVLPKGWDEMEKQVVSLKKPFTQWFDKKGNFIAEPFQQMLASNVEVIGKADPKRVVEEAKKKQAVPREENEGKIMGMEDKWASLLAESSGVSLEETSAETPSKASKKRSKKS